MMNASRPKVAASNSAALNPSDQWMPMKLPPMPMVTPLKERRPLCYML